jgi:hypothetical protein
MCLCDVLLFLICSPSLLFFVVPVFFLYIYLFLVTACVHPCLSTVLFFLVKMACFFFKGLLLLRVLQNCVIR